MHWGKGLTRSKLEAEEISQAIARYNKYRSPEATARLISFEDNELRVQFQGAFCTTCGFYDYLEDFIFELKETVDVSMKIDTIEESSFQTFIVRYVIDK
jgi:hypothetical protein